MSWAKNIRVSHKNQWGERIQIWKFSTYYENTKFTGEPIRLVRQIKVGGILDQGNLTLRIVLNDTSLSIVIGIGCVCVCITPDFNLIKQTKSNN